MSIIERFSDAIAHAEGFYATGSLPARCHNPGDLCLGDKGFGTARSTGYGASDITIFGSDVDGWTALHNQVSHMLSGASHVYRSGMTLLDVAKTYAMDVQWGINVATRLGVAPTITLGELAKLGS